MSDTILVEKRGGVTSLTLNRPERLNAFNVEMHQALSTALDEVETDDTCRAVLLTGAGRAFCAGQDLSDRQRKAGESARDLGHSLDTYYNPLVRRIRALEKPVVVAVNGVAAGAGANLALNGDIILAARSARFVEPFCRLGLAPDAGGTWILTRTLGEARAKAIAMLGEPIPAETAEAWGLIWKVVDDEALATAAFEMAQTLARGPTQGHAAVKAAIHQAATNTLDQQLDVERDLNRVLGYTPDYAEGVNAFLEKRPAVFTGRKG